MTDEAVSILNDVLGPVMRGPSSSHTAGSHRIGLLVRRLLGTEPISARVRFDPDGSYAQVYREQGSDRALATGLLGWSVTDARFAHGLAEAAEAGLYLEFGVEVLAGADHPNTVEIEVRAADGTPLAVRAKSIGGGRVVLDRLDQWTVQVTGQSHELLRACDGDLESEIVGLLAAETESVFSLAARATDGPRVLLHHLALRAPREELLDRLRGMKGVRRVWYAAPLYLVRQGPPLFQCAAEMIEAAAEHDWTLGQAALAHEAQLLGRDEAELAREMINRHEIMAEAVRRGLDDGEANMLLLGPSAGGVMRADEAGKLPTGGLHTRAAARAMAVMHGNGSGAVVVAAPTAGAAGTLPGVMVSLVEELGADEDAIVRGLFAAGAVGLVLATRATFAAEIAGCQVEIGAAGAMAAAAVVEVAGGTAQQAADAAAISFQNTMGSVCDLVQGIVEIPCHTRNAVAASSAFVCADLILGGYANPVPLDETIDAVYAVGRMLPGELRCTALVGIALAPSALSLERRR